MSAGTAAVFLNTTTVDASDDWRRDLPCGVGPARFEPAKLDECTRAYCADAADTRICACLNSELADETTVMVEYRGAVTTRWTTGVMSFMAESFRLDRADLDGDGSEELLLAAMGTVSSGMGVEHWTAWVIDEGKVSDPIEIQDYGTMGFLTRPGRGEACYLLVSRWIEGWEPKRGTGLYIVGRWYRFSTGRLWPLSERPPVYRRYLFSLQKARASLFEKPLLWFASEEAQPVAGPFPFE